MLVLGEGWTAVDALSFAFLRGCLWRACCPESPAGRLAEYPVAAAAGIGRLPHPPDAVVVVAPDNEWITVATRVCADRSTVVLASAPAAPLDLQLYPDVHRRGLQLTVLASVGATPAHAESFVRLVRTREIGLAAVER